MLPILYLLVSDFYHGFSKKSLIIIADVEMHALFKYSYFVALYLNLPMSLSQCCTSIFLACNIRNHGKVWSTRLANFCMHGYSYRGEIVFGILYTNTLQYLLGYRTFILLYTLACGHGLLL